MRLALIAVTVATSLALVAPALGDSRMVVGAGTLYFRSEDAGIANRLTIDNGSRGRAHFVDDADPYGISFPTPPCTPGRVNSAGNPVEIFCDRGSYRAIAVQIGPGEDHVTYKLDDLPVSIEGGGGADTLTSAGAGDDVHGGDGNDVVGAGAGNDVLTGDAGDDTLRAGEGSDRIDGGPGADTIDAGPGDDTIGAADGSPDTIECGDGNDTASVDATDRVANCEHVTKTDVAPPVGQPAGDDHRPPAVAVGGRASQPVGRHIAVAMTSTEPGRVDLSAYLSAGGINDRLAPATAVVNVGGGGVIINIRLSRRQIARIRSDLRKGHRPTAVITVSASDTAGNTSRPRKLTITIRRR